MTFLQQEKSGNLDDSIGRTCLIETQESGEVFAGMWEIKESEDWKKPSSQAVLSEGCLQPL